MWIRSFLGGDFTPLEHAIYAIFMWIVVFGLTFWIDQSFAAGAATAFPIAFFFGREHAQQQVYFSETEEPLGDWDACRFWLWDYPSQMDLYCPAAVSFMMGCIALCLS